MNLGNPNGQSVQDSTANIAENYRRLQAVIRCEDRPRLFAHQVHGDCVLSAAGPITDDCDLGKGDAIFSDSPAVLVSVRTADCVPILLSSLDGREVAAVHAGWRGVVASIVIKAIERFRDPSAVIATIGPAIGYDHFEVGQEVADVFLALPVSSFDTPQFVRPVAGEKSLIDLRRVITMQLHSAGVPAERIDSTTACTIADHADFFSHRRSGGLTGRMAALIGARR